MKKRNFNTRVYSILLLILMSAYCSVAQVTSGGGKLIISTQVPQIIEACGGSQAFTVTLTNTTGSTVSDIHVFPSFISGFEFDNLTPITSTSSTTVTLGTSSVFEFVVNGTIPDASSINFTFRMKAVCGIISSIRNLYGNDVSKVSVNHQTRVEYQYPVGTTYFDIEPSGSQSYNVAMPKLNLFADTDTRSLTLNINDTKVRKLKITNGGNGKLDAFQVKITYDIGVVLLSLKDNNGNTFSQVGAPVTANGRTTYTLLVNNFSATTGGTVNQFFELNESLDLKETIKVDQCLAATDNDGHITDYQAAWGCDNTVCDDGTKNDEDNAFISIINGEPTIGVTLTNSVNKLDPCQPTTVAGYYLTFRNDRTGGDPVSDRARDIRLFFDFASNLVQISSIKIYNNQSPGAYVPLTYQVVQNGGVDSKRAIVDFVNYTTDIDGALGLESMDDDGIFNDLPLGKELNILVEYTASCFAVQGQCNQFYNGTNYISNYMRYNDACLSYGLGDLQQTSVAWNQYISLTTNITPQVEGPVDLLDAQVVTFKIRNNIYLPQYTLDQFACGSGLDNFSATVTLPDGFVFDADGSGNVAVSWITGEDVNTAVPVTSVLSADHKTLEIKQGGVYGYYSFPIKLVCQSGLSESGLIDYKYFYLCNAACSTSCKAPLGCTTYEIFRHCPVTIGGGGGGGSGGCFRTTSVVAERITLGKVEPTLAPYYTISQWNAAPDVVATQSGLVLDRAMEYDQVKITANGIFQATGGYTAQTAKINLQYKTPFISPSKLEIFNLVSAVVYINALPACTLNLTGLQATTPYVSPDDDIYVWDFTVPSACKSSFSDGDVIRLELIVQVPFIDPAVYTDFGILPVTKLRARHHGLDNSNQAIGGCESFGDFFSIFRNDAIPITGIGIGINCNGGISRAAWSAYRSVVDYFPGEFRPFSYLNNVSLDIQTGYSVVGSSQSQTARYYVHPNYVPINYQVVNNKIVMTQDNSWIVGENEYYDYIDLDVIQSCKPVPLISSSQYTIAKYVYTRNPSIISQRSVSAEAFSEAGDATIADLTALIEPIQNGYKKEVEWPVTICNNTNRNANAANTWLAFVPQATGITITKLKINGNVLFPYKTYASGISNITMFQIGTVGEDQCISISVVGEYTNCQENKIDNITMTMGWNCNKYPANLDPTSLTCDNSIKNTTLQLRYKTTSLLSVVTKLGDETINVCEDITYQVQYISTGNANLNDLSLVIKLPRVAGKQGVTYVTNSLVYDYGAQVDQPLGKNPFAGFDGINDYYSINLSSAGTLPLSLNDPVGELPGIYAPGNQNVLTVRFKLRTNCSADGGLSKVLITPTAKNNCGQVQTSGDFQFKLEFNGLTPQDKTSTTIVGVNNFNEITGRTNFSVNVRNNGDHNLYDAPLNTVDRYMVLKLPVGINCINPSNPEFTEESDGNKSYFFKLDDLTPLQVQKFSVTIEKTNYDATTRGNVINIEASTIMQINAACGVTVTCKLRNTTSSDKKQIFLPSNFCAGCISTFAPKEGSKYIITAWVRLEGIAPNILGFSQANISLYFKGPNVLLGPMYPSGLVIDGWQRIEREFVVPSGVNEIEIRLNNLGYQKNVFFDDIRIHPVNSNMKTFVYDRNSLRLAAELDENNYATFYEYDQEGGLVRVKKETERGIMTIQESRSNNIKQ